MSICKTGFVVEFCRNCDGGEQERDAATEAIKRVVPDADVKAVRLDSYPVRVKVYYDGKVIWESAQRNLFRKYWSARTQSQSEIEAAVTECLKA